MARQNPMALLDLSSGPAKSEEREDFCQALIGVLDPHALRFHRVRLGARDLSDNPHPARYQYPVDELAAFDITWRLKMRASLGQHRRLADCPGSAADFVTSRAVNPLVGQQQLHSPRSRFRKECQGLDKCVYPVASS